MSNTAHLRLSILNHADLSGGASSIEINEFARNIDTSPELLIDVLKNMSQEGLIDLYRLTSDGESVNLYDASTFTDSDFFCSGDFRVRITFEGRLGLGVKQLKQQRA
jgi:DNA-binding IscR family transcriptional regulator